MKPIKTFKAAGKKVEVFDKPKNVPSKKFIDKVYSKLPDDQKIPLQFMKRKTYLKEYAKNQEIKNHHKFPQQEKEEYVKKEMPFYNNVVGRYTTKKNPYYKPAVVVFNDNKLSNDEFKFLVGHETKHELLEKEHKKMAKDKEEMVCDAYAEDFVSKNMAWDIDKKTNYPIYDNPGSFGFKGIKQFENPEKVYNDMPISKDKGPYKYALTIDNVYGDEKFVPGDMKKLKEAILSPTEKVPPILIEEKNNKPTLFEGRHRLAAAIELGVDVPTIRIKKKEPYKYNDALTEEENNRLEQDDSSNNKITNDKVLAFDRQRSGAAHFTSYFDTEGKRPNFFDNTNKSLILNIDKDSNNLTLDNHMDRYITEPTRKGKGLCGEAACDLISSAVKQGVPLEEMNVYGVQLKHPHKEGTSNHIIAQIQGKYYDPTKTQYGDYSENITTELPGHYKNVTKQNLPSFIHDDNSKDRQIVQVYQGNVQWHPGIQGTDVVNHSDVFEPNDEAIRLRVGKSLRGEPEIVLSSVGSEDEYTDKILSNRGKFNDMRSGIKTLYERENLDKKTPVKLIHHNRVGSLGVVEDFTSGNMLTPYARQQDKLNSVFMTGNPTSSLSSSMISSPYPSPQKTLVYKCSKCGKEFFEYQRLREHKVIEHGGEY